MDARRLTTAGATGLTVVIATLTWAGPSSAQAHGPTGFVAGADNASTLLAEPAHGQAAVSALGDDLALAAARNGMTSSRLTSLLASDATAWLNSAGQLYYVEPASPRTDVTAGGSATSTVAASTPYPLDQTFALHSQPGSTRTIYLDFDGQTVSGSIWNDNSSLPAGFYPGWSTDGDASTFDDAERSAIQSIWQRVSEDYASFDVDVTTADPGSDGLTRSNASDDTFGTRALFSPSDAARTAVCGGSCGGVAYVGTFDSTSTTPDYVQPAWIFPQGLGPNSAKFMAEAASHEVGHTLGLAHDGTSTKGYYTGQGSWAPIMGVGYGEPITQWSRGEYADANNQQDDFAVMSANGLSLRSDEAGGTTGSATALTGASTSGFVTSAQDVDVYAVNRACSTAFTAAAVPAPTSPNLDIGLTLLDATGAELEHADPASGGSGDVATGLSAAIGSHAGPGAFYLVVDGVGSGDPATNGYSDYGSVGQYTLSISGVCTVGTPSAPRKATAQVDSPNAAVDLTWNAPSSDGGSPVTAYRVFKNGYLVTALAGTERSYRFDGFERGETATLSVRAVNANGNSPAAAVTASIAALPGPATSVTAQRGNKAVTLSWQEPLNVGDAAITGYVLHELALDGTVLKTAKVSTGARAYAWQGLTNGTPYTFDVTAVSGDFNGSTVATGSVTPARTPWRPHIGVASSGALGAASSVSVSWTAPASDGGSPLTGYVVKALRIGNTGAVVQSVVSAPVSADTPRTRSRCRGQGAGRSRCARSTTSAWAWAALDPTS